MSGIWNAAYGVGENIFLTAKATVTGLLPTAWRSSFASPLANRSAVSGSRLIRKVVIDAPGMSYDRLQLRSVSARDTLSADEVRVEVSFSGVNYADVCVRMGFYASAKKYVGWPCTPGFEFAGIVTQTGTAVTDLPVGMQVFGVTRFDAYASEVIVPRSQLYAIPKKMSPASAAAFPAVHLTAWFGLCELVKLRKGMRVLIHSAAGGVGGAMVQLAVAAGCDVTAVVGATHKVQYAKDLGAQHVIDKSTCDLWRTAEDISASGFDVIADANGVETLQASYDHLAPAGRLLVYGFHTMLPRTGHSLNYFKLAWDYLRTPRFNPLDMTGQNRSVLAFNLSYLFDMTEVFAEAMEYLLGLFATGQLQAPHTISFPIERVADAHRALESGLTVGKIVLQI